MTKEEQHSVKMDKVFVFSNEERMKYHRRSNMALENIIVLDEKTKMIMKKNESNRLSGCTKAQMTLLFSDFQTYLVEIHPWGIPPKQKETHKMTIQQIYDCVFQGTFYITNINMLL